MCVSVASSFNVVKFVQNTMEGLIIFLFQALVVFLCLAHVFITCVYIYKLLTWRFKDKHEFATGIGYIFGVNAFLIVVFQYFVDHMR